MPDPWTLIAWVIVSCIVVLLLSFLYGLLKTIIDQKLTDWKRNRAHAGKVKCENEHPGEGKCQLIATRVTPNGYFCDEHWEENSGKWGMYASVRYGHMLNHALKRRTAA